MNHSCICASFPGSDTFVLLNTWDSAWFAKFLNKLKSHIENTWLFTVFSLPFYPICITERRSHKGLELRGMIWLGCPLGDLFWQELCMWPWCVGLRRPQSEVVWCIEQDWPWEGSGFHSTLLCPCSLPNIGCHNNECTEKWLDGAFLLCLSGFILLPGLLHLCHVLFGCANLAASSVSCSHQVLSLINWRTN